MTRRKNVILTDSSKNVIDPSFHLLSWKLNDNRQKPTFHHWKGKKNINKYISSNQNKNNINTKNFIFNMGLDNILGDLKELREENYKHISYQNVVNHLDSLNRKPLLLTNKDEKSDWDNWVKTVNRDYTNINLGNHVGASNYSLSNYSSRRRSVYSVVAPSPMRLPAPPPLPPPLEKVNIDVEINSLKDILQLCTDYPLKVGVEYNINMKAIHNIKEPLQELEDMIGLEPLKLSVMEQILYFIQNLHKTGNIKNNDFMHTVIYGPPGTGKTEVAKKMGRIFSKMGVLSRNVFKKATRADLIAGYLGQTALKTKDIVKECLGGVLFIDEAYALGNDEKRDSFAKECIDTLCEALSDHKDDLMVIIAGYEDELKTCFFDYNQGLDSRFTWRFKTTDYNADELKLIFEKKVKDVKWDFKSEIPTSWFNSKKKYFKFFGRDMETLFAKTKIAHSRRIFCKSKDDRKKLTLQDLDRGFEMYCENSEVKGRNNGDEAVAHLYL